MQIKSQKGSYSVYFEENALDNLNDTIPENAHFIVDKQVAMLFESHMSNILSSRSVLLVEAKEENKSLEKFPGYVQHLVDQKLRRDHVLYSIGGGIIQDITCFLAATMLRGVAWQFLPTTLLSQADSCIGSKSSINVGNSKNILGTFTPPKEIYISTAFLATLDEKDIHSGVGEMIKVHIIDGESSFKAIASDFDRLFSEKALMIHYIRRSLEIKQGYIEIDEFDQNIRNVFNYGHSFGHAIEAATQFVVPHGIAVTIGMDMANYVAMKMDITSKDHYERMHPVLRKNYSEFSDTPVPIDAFIKAISKDKKNIGCSSVTLILVDSKAKVFRESYPNDTNFSHICEEFLTQIRPK